MDTARLVIDPAVDILEHDDGTVRFRAPGSDFAMRDPVGLVRRVTRQCREGATGDALVALSTEPDERQAVEAMVGVLCQRRILTTDTHCATQEPLVEWLRHYAGVQRTSVLPDMQIEGNGRLHAALTRSLRGAGFTVRNEDELNAGKVAACRIAACDHANMDWLRERNRTAVVQGQAFLPVWLDRSSVHWGPMIVPGSTGCLECAWHRGQALQRQGFVDIACETAGSSASSPCLAEFAALLAGTELLRWALGAHVDTEIGMAWCFDMLKMNFSGSKVLRLPRCPVCGSVCGDAS